MSRRITRWLLTLSVALVALCASFGSAAAAPRAADPPPENARLERAYQAEQLRLREMAQNAQRADAYADEVASMIVRLKQHGVNTTPLERALRVFRDRMAEARQLWESAREILTTHAGFDDQGHVSDVAAARRTVVQAHNRLLRAHTIGQAALRGLHAAVQAFREAHH